MNSANRPASRTVECALVIAATVAGAMLASDALGEKGLWLDESLSILRSSGGTAALWHEITSTQANMGLYYVLLHGWIPLFGTSEAAVRSLSVVFATAMLPVVYLFTRTLFDARAGLFTIGLLILNSFFVRHSQEARGYSLVAFLVTLSTYALVRGLERPASRGRWLTYVMAGALSVYAHLFGALVLVAHTAWVLLQPRRPWPWRFLTRAWIAIALLVAPLGVFAVAGDVGQIDWIPPPRVIDLAYVLRALSGDAGWPLLGLYGLACLLTLGFSPTAGSEPPAHLPRAPALVWAWLLIPVVLAFGVSSVKPVFQSRYLIVALAPLVILAGAGLSRLRPTALVWPALAAMLALSAAGVRDWREAPERQFWRRTAAFVMSQAEPGDAVAFYVYSARVPFEYYVERLGLARPDVHLVDLTADPWIAGNRQPEPSAGVLDDLATSRARVWLVRLQDRTAPGHPLGRYEQIRQIESALTSRLSRTVDAAFPGGIRVERYDRAPVRSPGRP